MKKFSISIHGKGISSLIHLVLGISLLISILSLGACSTKTTDDQATDNQTTGNVLATPTDFTFDTQTGEFSFTASDANAGYYFVRAYHSGETSEYVASSKRLAGGTTGTISGTIDISGIGWGDYDINLVSFAAAGSGYTAPDPVTLKAQYGVGLNLERPEMLAMWSGNQVELVIDWWTLCDYNFKQHMPEMKFTFYSDEACTNEVKSETVDLSDLLATLKMNPPGLEYIWGWNTKDALHYYTTVNEATFGFKYNLYPYTMDAGTYYVTCQAISKYDYSNDSQVSTPIEFTLTDAEPTSEFEYATTQLWTDPQQMDMPGANPGMQAGRVDGCVEQVVSGQIVE